MPRYCVIFMARSGTIVGYPTVLPKLSLNHACSHWFPAHNGARPMMFRLGAAARSGAAHQQRIAARLATLRVAAREHVRDAVLQPFIARQMLDDDGAGPQRLRC